MASRESRDSLKARGILEDVSDAHALPVRASMTHIFARRIVKYGLEHREELLDLQRRGIYREAIAASSAQLARQFARINVKAGLERRESIGQLKQQGVFRNMKPGMLKVDKEIRKVRQLI
jgi:hypothetical protein